MGAVRISTLPFGRDRENYITDVDRQGHTVLQGIRPRAHGIEDLSRGPTSRSEFVQAEDSHLQGVLAQINLFPDPRYSRGGDMLPMRGKSAVRDAGEFNPVRIWRAIGIYECHGA